MDKINVDELFRCFNCDYMVDEPHESECCGKLYCQSCMVDLSYTQCKLCKKSIKLRANMFAKNLLQRVELKCRHHCGNKFTYEEMKLHMYRCESRIYKCTVEICCFVGRKYELIPHMMENHDIYILALLENYDDFHETFDKIIKNPIDKRPPKKGSPFNSEMECSYPSFLPRLRTIINSNIDNSNNNNNLLNRNSNNVNEFNYDFDDFFNEVDNYNNIEREYYDDYINPNFYRRSRLRPIFNYNNNTGMLPSGQIENLSMNLENASNTNNSPNLNNANNINGNNIANNVNNSQDNLITEINNNFSSTNPIFRQAPLTNFANDENNLFNPNIGKNSLQVNNLHNQLNNQILNLHNNIDEFTEISNNVMRFREDSPYDSFGVNYNIVENAGNSHVYEMSFNAINDEEEASDVDDIHSTHQQYYHDDNSNFHDHNDVRGETNNNNQYKPEWL